jgi:hypothetical protein
MGAAPGASRAGLVDLARCVVGVDRGARLRGGTRQGRFL